MTFIMVKKTIKKTSIRKPTELSVQDLYSYCKANLDEPENMDESNFIRAKPTAHEIELNDGWKISNIDVLDEKITFNRCHIG